MAKRAQKEGSKQLALGFAAETASVKAQATGTVLQFRRATASPANGDSRTAATQRLLQKAKSMRW
jgi:hypothetical protein